MNIRVHTNSKTSFSLAAWREKLITNILRGTSVFVVPALIIAGYSMIGHGLFLQLGIDIVLVALLLVITLAPVPFQFRSIIGLFLLYLISANTILEVGIHGDTRLFFFIFVLLAAMLFDLRTAIGALALTIVTFIIVASLLFTGLISLTNPIAVLYPIETWISDSFIFITLACIALAGTTTLLSEFAFARANVEEMIGRLEEEQHHLERRVAERTHELEVLHQTSLDISGQLDRMEVLRNIVERGCSLVHVDAGCIYIFDEESKTLELIFASGFSRDYSGIRITPKNGFTEKVFSSGEPLVIEDYTTWPDRTEYWENEIKSLLAVPLRYGSEMFGVLVFAQIEEHRRFNDDVVWIAALFANQASIAINNANLYKKAQNEIRDRIHAEEALEKSKEQIRHDALHDALTGLPNRDLLIARLVHAIARAKRKKFLFAVIFIDIDRFKVINDSLGYVTGDKLLSAIARRLETCIRAVDMVARLGGDEFVVYLEDIKEPIDATDVADRLLCKLKLPFIVDNRHVHVTASMGIVLSALGYEQSEDMLRDADIALYRAKGLGKAKYEIFETSQYGEAIARLDLENDLHKALEHREFYLNYQPIINLETGRPISMEALARWKHPVKGVVPPIDFIPVAEETGLIIPLGKWVLAEACAQMRAWQVEYPFEPELGISVNLSPRQFMQPDLVEQLERVIAESGINPHSLHLEITESILMQNIEYTIGILTRLREIGMRIELDDFGTDYSSLYYLQQIPVDTIKIDRSFVSKMNADNKNAGIVRAIITLANELGMNTVAEGIETNEQLEFLKSLKCGFGQGYFIAKPMDSPAMKTYLEKHCGK
jgi:diguanylate cyclase (GGDEF)-like protein